MGAESRQKNPTRPFRRPGYAERASRLLFCEGWLVGREQGTGKKFLPRRNRIPLQAAFSGGLAAQHVLASFLWGKVLYRA